jgi:signal transduction histidine kinase
LKTIKFSVDASLLQELGERLIGQPHIALAEMVKNSYDADATVCALTFEPDSIEIVDNGHGMTFDDFKRFWMRVGTTHKVDERRSRKYKRPFTGSKGLGRLAAQFLADEMTIETRPTDARGIEAELNWGHVVRGDDLISVEVPWRPLGQSVVFADGSETGTRIVLKRLKGGWSSSELEALGNELWRLRSPFGREAPTGSRDPGFSIEVDAPEVVNAKETFDAGLQRVFSNWRARITGSIESGMTDRQGTVSVEFKAGHGASRAQTFTQSFKLPLRGDKVVNLDRVKFQILVFNLKGRQTAGVQVGELRDYLEEYGNVALYDGGFRLPYYGSGRNDVTGQDWLGLAADQGRRITISELLPPKLRVADKYMLDLPAPGRIFGAVEVDTGHERQVGEATKRSPGSWLEIQPGRDRLRDNSAFQQLRDFVRYSVDFYANRYRFRTASEADLMRDKEPPSAKQNRALETIQRHAAQMPPAAFKAITREVSEAVDASRRQEENLDRRAALLAPLASAGMLSLSLNHELVRESRILNQLARTVRDLNETYHDERLAKLSEELTEVRRRLRSIQDIFGPLLGNTDLQAGERLKVRAVVSEATRAMKPLLPGIEIEVGRDEHELRFPLGSFAEWSAIIQNALTNAWDAMLSATERRVEFRLAQRGRQGSLTISDTGVGLGVSLTEANRRFFEPFERQGRAEPARRSIAFGGQGLGLSIVRMIATRRNAEVAFVEPVDGYSTSLELSWRT